MNANAPVHVVLTEERWDEFHLHCRLPLFLDMPSGILRMQIAGTKTVFWRGSISENMLRDRDEYVERTNKGQ